MANPHLLSWWAMIQSVANFGWGVGQTACDCNSYWAHTVSSATRNRRMKELTSNLIFKYREVLRKSRARLFCFENFQIGQEIKDQRGMHSSTFFKGTNQCAHCVHEFVDLSWDESIRTTVTGLSNQKYPSPPGMVAYENAPENEKLGDFIMRRQWMTL